MSPHDRLLLLIDNLRGNREFRLVDADLSALIDIDARITELEAESARLREAHSDARSALRVACDWLMRLADKYDPQDTEQARPLIRAMRLAGALQEGSDD